MFSAHLRLLAHAVNSLPEYVQDEIFLVCCVQQPAAVDELHY